MKALYKRTFLLTILMIMFIFRPVYLPLGNFEGTFSKVGTLKVMLTKNATNGNSDIINSSDLRFYPSFSSHTNILTILTTRKFIFSTLSELKLPIFDIRKRILSLMNNFFQGSKYKNSFSLT